MNNAQAPNTHTALAFRSFFTVSRPSSLGFSLTCQSIFVFHTKILSPLLPFGSLSQLVCSRTPCFSFPKSEICHNSDISFFPIGYSITFRISDSHTIWWCQRRGGELVGLSGSICFLLVPRPKSRVSLIPCGPETGGSHSELDLLPRLAFQTHTYM